jgi:hypothetical protein
LGDLGQPHATNRGNKLIPSLTCGSKLQQLPPLTTTCQRPTEQARSRHGAGTELAQASTGVDGKNSDLLPTPAAQGV